MSVQPSELDTATTPVEPAPPTVLISEYEVMLATAAVTSAIVPTHTAPAPAAPASAAPRQAESEQPSSRLARWSRRWSARTVDRPRRQYYPARYTFLENAAMSREMDRL